MSRHIFGWDLPPGCTNADIDRAFGGDDVEREECDTCGGDGFIDAKPTGFWHRFCIRFLGHPQPTKECRRCHGEGYIDEEQQRQESAELRADIAYDRWKEKQLGL